MARANETEEVVEDDKFRLSISLDASLRRNIRIAAAYNDMTPGEWASSVLEKMADKAIQDEG